MASMPRPCQPPLPVRANATPPHSVMSGLQRVIGRYFHTAPATTLYLFSLLVTSLVVRTSSTRLVSRLLRQDSTNLFNMGHHPGKVLVVSAFLIERGSVVPWLVGFALVLAPAERWVGSARWLVLFAVGHVGATLITLAGIWHITHGGRTDMTLVHNIDVGISYGFYAVAAALCYRFPQKWRLLYVGALLTDSAIVAVATREFTDAGHLCAVLLGLLAWPVVRGRVTGNYLESNRVAIGHLAAVTGDVRWPLDTTLVAVWAVLLLVSLPVGAVALSLASIPDIGITPGVVVIAITTAAATGIVVRDRDEQRASRLDPGPLDGGTDVTERGPGLG